MCIPRYMNVYINTQIFMHISTHMCIPHGGRSCSTNWPIVYIHKCIYTWLPICVYLAEAVAFPQIGLLYKCIYIYKYIYIIIHICVYPVEATAFPQIGLVYIMYIHICTYRNVCIYEYTYMYATVAEVFPQIGLLYIMYIHMYIHECMSTIYNVYTCEHV